MRYSRQVRRIGKCYPPQLSRIGGSVLLYNPREHWIQAHSVGYTQELCQLPSYQPMFLNANDPNESDTTMQGNRSLYVLRYNEQGLSCMTLGNSKSQIASQSVMESGKVINFDRDGALQVWSICSIEDDIDDNPEAQRVDSKSHPQHKVNTSLWSYSPITNRKNGLKLAPLLKRQNQLYTLSTHDQLSCVLSCDIEQGHVPIRRYSSQLQSSINQLVKYSQDLICAYGGCNAILVDHRSQKQVINLNNIRSDIHQVTPFDYGLQLLRGNDLIEIDLRNHSETVVLHHNSPLSTFVINGEGYCFVGERDTSKVAVYTKGAQPELID